MKTIYNEYIQTSPSICSVLACWRRTAKGTSHDACCLGQAIIDLYSASRTPRRKRTDSCWETGSMTAEWAESFKEDRFKGCSGFGWFWDMVSLWIPDHTLSNSASVCWGHRHAPLHTKFLGKGWRRRDSVSHPCTISWLAAGYSETWIRRVSDKKKEQGGQRMPPQGCAMLCSGDRGLQSPQLDCYDLVSNFFLTNKFLVQRINI